MQPIARDIWHGPPPATTRFPIEFSRAWIHLIDFWLLARMSVVPYTTSMAVEPIQAQLEKCLQSLEDGRDRFLRMQASTPLNDCEAVLPSGIISLLVNKLTAGTANDSPDIVTTYHAYMAKLVSTTLP